MHEILADLPGAKCILDDVIVYGKTKQEHDRNLHGVLHKFLNVGLKLNDKCVFNVQTVEFFGHVLSPEGLSPHPKIKSAILDAPSPVDVNTLRSFLGLVGYYSKFCPDYATLVEPMRRLTRKDTPFLWSDEAQASFEKVKTLIADHITLAYFDPNRTTIVTTDASSYGLGATLSQVTESGAVVIVCCASRTLSVHERKYSTGEREAFACVFACERFHDYIWGRPFELYTDHEALVTLLTSKGSGRRPMRIARWKCRLLPYNYTIRYKPGSENVVADALSRLPLPEITEPDCDDEFVCNLIEGIDPEMSISLPELVSESNNDPLFGKLKVLISKGWPCRRTCEPDLKYYHTFRNELSVRNDLIMRGERILVPASLHSKLIQLAHKSHQGIVRTKQRLRSLYWWRSMDEDVETAIKNCFVCVTHDKTAKPKFAPLKPVPLPDEPWKKLGLDIVGPNYQVKPKYRYAITLIDYYSRWPEVYFTPKIEAVDVISFMKEVFSREGFCAEIVTDNGVQFHSAEFEEFLLQRNIKHTFASLYYPQVCGEIERFNGVLNNAVKTAISCGEDIYDAIREFLCVYRSTVHFATGQAPSVLLHSREMRTGLHVRDLHKMTKQWSSDEVSEHVLKQQNHAKLYTDQKRGAEFLNLNVGDLVKVKKPGHVPKGIMKYGDPIKIVEKCSDSTYRTSDGRIWNQSKLCPVPNVFHKLVKDNASIHDDSIQIDVPDVSKSSQKDSTVSGSAPNDAQNSDSSSRIITRDISGSESQETLRRSTRNRRPPDWHKDFYVQKF